MTVLAWFLGSAVLLEALALVAMVTVLIRQLEWLKAVLVPWLNNINQKLGLPR